MAVQQPDGAIRSIAFGAITDSTFSADGSRLYTARGGTVTGYDVNSGAQVGSWALGTNVGGLDVSVDGKYLVGVEQQTSTFNTTGGSTTINYSIYRIDLVTSTATTYALPQTGYYTYPFYDAAFLPDGKVLLSNQGGWTPLTTFDFSSRAQATTSQTFANSSTITASPDHQHLAVLPSNISDAPVYVFTPGSGITASHGNYADNVMGYNRGAQAISPAGNIVVQGVGLNVYDGQLRLQLSLSDRYPYWNAGNITGLAFSPTGDSLYLLDYNSREVFQLNTTTWEVVRGFPVQTDLAQYPAGFGDTLQVSQDGHYLSVIGSGTVQLIDLRSVVSDAGTSGGDVITGDGAANVLYGFAGDDRLDGGAGPDSMYGGTGNDTYIVDNGGDLANERPGEGNDTVYSSVSYTLPSNVETLVLTGGAVNGTANGVNSTLIGNDIANGLTGGAGDDTLRGNGGNDTLSGGINNDWLDGGDGNDTLIGGSGADTLTGGAGNDMFLGVRSELNGDRILDLSAGDRITISDQAYAGFSYTRVGSVLNLGQSALVDVGAGNPRFAIAASTNGGTDLLAVNRMSGLNDFNADGHSDMLWRNANGAVSTWAVSGNMRGDQVQQSAFNANIGTDWKITDTFDFNGDGRSDILWRNANGSFSIWNGSAGGFQQGAYNDGSVGNEWQIATTGDINGDGKDDLLWRHQDGSISSWNSTGSGFQSNSYYHGSVGTSWKVEGLADVNGDGRADIVWRNDSGALSTWLSTGSGFQEGAYNSGADPSWHIAGLADFNGDGRADILWRNDNGGLSLWRSNGAGFDQGVYNTAVPTSWHVATVGDFNGDGRADILWRNDNGALSTWQSNGSGFDPGVYNASVDTSWSIVGHVFPL